MALSYIEDTITHSTTGVKTWTTGFQPKIVDFYVVPAPGSTITDPRWSHGTSDGTFQLCDQTSIYSSRRQERFTDRMASIWTWNGTTWTEAYKISLDSFTATEVKYNVNTASSSYQLYRRAWG